LEKTATGFSSMMDWTLVLVADMLAGEARVKNERRKDMVAVVRGSALELTGMSVGGLCAGVMDETLNTFLI
jgi:hypothetical protein